MSFESLPRQDLNHEDSEDHETTQPQSVVPKLPDGEVDWEEFLNSTESAD